MDDFGASVIRPCAPFFSSTFHTLLSSFQLCPLLWKVARHLPEPHSHLPFKQSSNSPFRASPLIVSARPSLFCFLNPAGVFLGILRKTLGVDPGMTPVQFQACEELHSLELSLILQCQEFSWSLRQAIRDCWRRRWYRTVRPSYTTRREAADKRGADTLNMQQIPFFSLSVSFNMFTVKNRRCLQNHFFLAEQCKQDKEIASLMQTSGVSEVWRLGACHSGYNVITDEMLTWL